MPEKGLFALDVENLLCIEFLLYASSSSFSIFGLRSSVFGLRSSVFGLRFINTHNLDLNWEVLKQIEYPDKFVGNIENFFVLPTLNHGGGGFFHSKGTWGCAAREGILFRTSSLAKGVLFGNFSRV